MHVIGIGQTGVHQQHVAGCTKKWLEVGHRGLRHSIGEREPQRRFLPCLQPAGLQADSHAIAGFFQTDVGLQIRRHRKQRAVIPRSDDRTLQHLSPPIHRQEVCDDHELAGRNVLAQFECSIGELLRMYVAEVLELSIDDKQMHEPLVNRRER